MVAQTTLAILFAQFWMKPVDFYIIYFVCMDQIHSIWTRYRTLRSILSGFQAKITPQNFCFYIFFPIFLPCHNETFCCVMTEITDQNKSFAGSMVKSVQLRLVMVTDAGDLAEFRVLNVTDGHRVNEGVKLVEKRFIGEISRTE